ncbi:MAG: hypothetical protein AAFZ52_12875 [Bacteroidota bacterium]
MFFATDRKRDDSSSPGRRLLLAVLGSVALRLSPIPVLVNYYFGSFLGWQLRVAWLLLGGAVVWLFFRRERRLEIGKRQLTKELVTAPLELLPEGALFLLVYYFDPGWSAVDVFRAWLRFVLYLRELY